MAWYDIVCTVIDSVVRRPDLAPTQNHSDAYGPLTPAMFHVLLALAEDDLHGYAILKEVELTLYGIIKRLLADGLIAELRSRPAAPQDDERRRYYRLTPHGREVAAAEAERMNEVVALARAKNLLKKLRTA
jgi:DNA-binding MarR family transcriptional regulator